MNDTFCIMPFVHFYTQPDGEVKPCCIADGFDNKQSLRNNTIKNIFNSDEYKKLREDMLTGKRNKICNVCYKKEDMGEFSPRKIYNNNLTIGGPCEWKMSDVNSDYSVPVEFQTIDIRFSNLCNFKCRMCNHTFSSHWYDDAKKIKVNGEFAYTSNEDKKVIQASENIIEEILPHLNNLKSVYFAGGEPLISDQHHQLLDWMSKNLQDTEDTNGLGIRKKLTMHYNTNLSILDYRNHNFIDYWNKFKRVHLAISCDGIGSVGEYQRVGFGHDKFIENLSTLRESATPSAPEDPLDGISYSFQYTTTILNIEHVFDFIEFMMDNKFITKENCISFYYAWGPEWMCIRNIPDDDKVRITEMFEEKMKNISSESTKQQLMSILAEMNSPRTYPSNLVYDGIKQLDDLHGTDYKQITNIRLGE